MARFRANFSDSSDDESSSSSEQETQQQNQETQDEEDSDQEVSGPRSSSVDMHEDELLTSRTRRRNQSKRNALVEDEDGEIRYAHEVNGTRGSGVRTSSTSPSTSPPPPSKSRGDPTILPWAQQIGVDAQRMHVMQTSLFRVPEEAAALKALNQQPQPTRQNLRVPFQPLNRKHSRDSDGDGFRVDARERASFAHDIEPQAYRPTRKYARVESSESAVKGNEGAVYDAGLAFGRSFRVGWGPGGVLVHLGSLCGPLSTPGTSANSSTINKTVVLTVPHTDHAKSFSEKILQHHLSNSPIDLDDDNIPFADPNPTSLHFSSFVSLFPTADRSYEASLFRLGHALFDHIDLRLGKSITIDIRNRVAAIRRKGALSAWLEDVVSPTLEAELRSNTSSDAATTAFTLLTGNKATKAVTVAMDGGFMKLATLISQAGGDWEFQEDLHEQLELWREQHIDTHIDESVRKLYALLAGAMDIYEGSRGGGLERCSDVDVLKGLDWKRAFGLHLWFSEPVDAPIARVFQVYDKRVKDAGQRQIARPLPWYSEKRPSSSPMLWRLPSTPSAADGLFSLIRLHADPACSLSQILTPLSFGTSPVDYSLSWHLYIILSRCMRIRDFPDRTDPVGRVRRLDNSLSDDDQDEDGIPQEGHSPSADLLASSYAFQLENLGLIQQAVFVLLHIEGSAGRKKAIKDLLGRSAGTFNPFEESGLVGSLRIPRPWVDEAKAQYALDSGKFYEAHELYYAAKLFNASHDLAILELAPDAVLHRDYELLNTLFSKFTKTGVSVDGWHVRGKVFLDYAKIMTELPNHTESGNAVPDAVQNTMMDELLQSVPRLILLLPDILRNSSDSRHGAAVSEMVSALVGQVKKLRPQVLPQIQPTSMTESTRLGQIQSMAYTRFLDVIS